ncbi:zinc-finger of the MIZ type in Nse subunit-domain-containing protein [Aspergillus carlsbadensis]|nr:zinc-finger of the MIZ type in Nse subunit-domain-containing protein [Aspergillus carlsbadensis]
MLSTPGPSRASRPRGRDRDRDRNRARDTATPRHREDRAGTPPLPAYQAPVGPLAEVGRTALVTLLRSSALRQLKTHVQHAELKLTESAGEVNERLTDATVRLKRKREKERERDVSRSMTEAGDGDAEGNEEKDRMDVDGGDADGGFEEEVARLKEFEEKVRGVTENLDMSMRNAIDSEVKIDALGVVLNGLQREAEANAAANGGTQRPRQRRRRTRRAGSDEEEAEEDEGELYEATPEADEGGDEHSLTRKLDERTAKDQEKWEDLSLTERYSENNSYVGFYRIIHEAKHPGDDPPPVPHASTWFSHLEDNARSSKRRNSSSAPTRRNTRQQRQRSASTDSDDLAIERERISLKCPLTLLHFKDPVTSTKCPHSFERAAITDMISRSGMTVPAPADSGSGGRPRRARAVKCPVCSEVLTANDLREDLVLLRRVRRAEAALRREREEEEDDELGFSERRRGRQRGIMLGSDDDDASGGAGRGNRMDVDQVRIKQERAMSRGMTEVEQDDEEQDENEDEDEDEEQEQEQGDATASGTETEEDSNSEGESNGDSE